MRRLIGALALLGILTLTVGASGAAAQTSSNSWYGPYINGPYGGVGASGYGSTGYGCGQGAYGFTQYGYGLAYALGPGMPQCGGFGSYPYLYPYTVGYPYANGVGAAGAIALSGMANPNPFFGTTGCDGFALGTNVSPGAFFGAVPGPSQQFNALNNVNVFNATSPAFGAVTNFQTFGTTGLTGCVALR